VSATIPLHISSAQAKRVFVGTAPAQSLFYGSKKLWPPVTTAQVSDSQFASNSDQSLGDLGSASFSDTSLCLGARGLTRIGFMFGPAVRITNATVRTDFGVYGIGILPQDTGFNLVRYMGGDLNITINGIGRSGYGNLGGVWYVDACGFWMDIPPSSLTLSSQIIVYYEFFGPYTAKHGIAFWRDGESGGTPDNSYVGTWDQYRCRLPITTNVPGGGGAPTLKSNTPCYRRVAIQNTPWME